MASTFNTTQTYSQTPDMKLAGFIVEKYEVSNVFMDSCEFNPTYNSELITHINELFSKSIILPKFHL